MYHPAVIIHSETTCYSTSDSTLESKERPGLYFFTGDTGSTEGTKGRSLASRLLSKKGDKRADKLSFGNHAQSGQRRGSSLPIFDIEDPLPAGPSSFRAPLPPAESVASVTAVAAPAFAPVPEVLEDNQRRSSTDIENSNR